MEPTVLPPDDGSTTLSRFWDSIVLAGPLQFAGLLAIVLALALLVGSPYLARRPRHMFMLIVAAILLGTAGYVAFDLRYVIVTFSMRDTAQVRADCEKLLARVRTTGGEAVDLSPDTAPDFPASFKKLGAESAYATEECVYLSLGLDGYVYSPKHAWSDPTRPKAYGWPRCRHTIYRDFYHFTPNLE